MIFTHINMLHGDSVERHTQPYCEFLQMNTISSDEINVMLTLCTVSVKLVSVLLVETDSLDTHVLHSATESYLPGCLNTFPQWREREEETKQNKKNKDLNQSTCSGL